MSELQTPTNNSDYIQEPESETPSQPKAQPETPAKTNKLPLKLIKPRKQTRSTKAEIAREKLTALIVTLYASGKTIDETIEATGASWHIIARVRKELEADEEFNALLTRQKTNELSELIEEGIKLNLRAMNNIVRATEDEIWVKSQRAPELATFFGVINDKTVRILAAIERANERERTERSVVPETREAFESRRELREAAAEA